MKTMHQFLKKGLIALFMIALLFLYAQLFHFIEPTIWRSVFLPGAVLILAVLLTPSRADARVRLAVTGVVLVFTLATTRLQPGYYLRTEIIVLAMLWGAGQIFLAIATTRVRNDVAGPLLRSLAETGYISTLRRMGHGAFGDALARGTRNTRWAIAVFLVSLLLSRAGAFDAEEEQLVLRPWFFHTLSGPSHSLVVSLTTPDNNPTEYLRTALELNRIFRKAGAVVSVFPRSGAVDPLAAKLLDSLTAMGGVTYDQPRFGWLEWGRPPGFVVTRYKAAGISWRTGEFVVHPSLVAAARYLASPIRLPKELLGTPTVGFPGAKLSIPRNTEVSVGERRIPIWDNGYAAVLNRQVLSRFEQWNSFLFRAEIERTHWDSALTYKAYGTGDKSHSLADSVWEHLKGKMVFVEWVNLGDDYRRDDATEPARIADMVVSGLVVDRAAAWHVALSGIVLLIGVLLSIRTRIWLQVAVLLASAVGLIVLDGWLFREWLLLANLVYPAFTAAVAALIFPLVRAAHDRE
jgi:hypothetical protein